MKKIKIILTIENFLNFFSITLSDGNIYFYHEYKNEYLKSENLLEVINNFLIKNKISYYDIDILALGNNILNNTSLRINFSIIQSLSLSWKLPVFKVNSLNSMIFELFLNSDVKNYFVIFDNISDIVYYKYFNFENIYDYDNYDFLTENINDIIISDNKTLTVSFLSKKNFLILKKNNFNKNIKSGLYSKSIYIDLLLRNLNRYNLSKLFTNNNISYIYNYTYKKYNLNY